METILNKKIASKEIILDENLQHIAMVRQRRIWNNKEQKYDYFDLDETKKFFSSFQIPKNEEMVMDVSGGTVKHRGLLYYLETCYNFHKGAVLRPDDFWYLMLSEIASVVKSRPEDFRKLFTDSSEKKDIIIYNADPVNMSFTTLIDALKKEVPTNTYAFLPKFSTSNAMTKLAFYASFADMISPYYNYMMYMCGIPKVKILGEYSEYQSLCDKVASLAQIFAADNDVLSYLERMHLTFEKLSNAIENSDSEFFKDIFYLEKCGSGSEHQICGWITQLFFKVEKSKIENYPSMVSMVEYTNLDTNKKYKKYVGLFGSREEDNYLIPEYGYFINEVKE